MGRWQTIADRWLVSKRAVGIHVHWLNAQQPVYALCVLEQRKQVLSIIDKKTGITTLEELSTHLLPGVPIYLSIEGKGVLVRKIAAENSNFLQEIIPDARTEDFYASRHPHQFVSVVRREVVDQTVAGLAQQGFFVLEAYTGLFALNNLLPFFSEEVSSIRIAGQELMITGQQVSSVVSFGEEVSEAPRYVVGEETIATRHLIAYATALSHFVPQSTGLPQTDLQREFRHRQLFTKALPATLGFFLLVLLINTFVYTKAFQRHEDLTTQTADHGVVLGRLNTLQQEVDTKEKFLATLGWQGTEGKAATTDRLSATVPDEVVLTEVTVNPQHKAEKNKQVFEDGAVRVVGHCSDMVVLNRWLVQLEAQSWVHQLTEQQYTADTDRRMGSFSFILKLVP